MGPQGTDQASGLHPGDPCLAELIGEDTGRSGDDRYFMTEPAQFEREFADMSLRAAENVPTREHMDNFHGRPWFSFPPAKNTEGRKVSLDGPPYQLASRFHRL